MWSGVRCQPPCFICDVNGHQHLVHPWPAVFPAYLQSSCADDEKWPDKQHDLDPDLESMWPWSNLAQTINVLPQNYWAFWVNHGKWLLIINQHWPYFTSIFWQIWSGLPWYIALCAAVINNNGHINEACQLSLSPRIFYIRSVPWQKLW